jgi:hypothetical protein
MITTPAKKTAQQFKLLSFPVGGSLQRAEVGHFRKAPKLLPAQDRCVCYSRKQPIKKVQDSRSQQDSVVGSSNGGSAVKEQRNLIHGIQL